MARTRRRFFRKRSFRRRGVRRRRVLFKKRSRRRVGLRKRSFRRRTGFRRRSRLRRRLIGRSMTLTAPNYSGNRSVFTKFIVRPRISTAWLFPDVASPADNTYCASTNCLGVIQLGQVVHQSAMPDVFPPVGHSGCLIVFSLDVFIRALFANWMSANRSTSALNADDVGAEFVRSGEELRYRRLNIDYNRSNLYKIELIFTRKAGRSTANATIAPSYHAGLTTIAAPEGGGTFGPMTMAPVVNQTANWVANTGGELNWFSQATNEHINPAKLHDRMRTGFPRDGITGNTTDAQKARTVRLLQEMGSREWKKHSGISSLRFTIKKQRGSNNQLVVIHRTTATSDFTLDYAYEVGKDQTNAFDNDNSTENKNQGRYGERLVDASNRSPGVSSDIIGTIPANNGPRGSLVIWCPYTVNFLEAYYDITLIGHYQFKDKGKSIIDSGIANTAVLE